MYGQQGNRGKGEDDDAPTEHKRAERVAVGREQCGHNVDQRCEGRIFARPRAAATAAAAAAICPGVRRGCLVKLSHSHGRCTDTKSNLVTRNTRHRGNSTVSINRLPLPKMCVYLYM